MSIPDNPIRTTHSPATSDERGIPSFAVVPSGPMRPLMFARGKKMAHTERPKSTPANWRKSACWINRTNLVSTIQWTNRLLCCWQTTTYSEAFIAGSGGGWGRSFVWSHGCFCVCCWPLCLIVRGRRMWGVAACCVCWGVPEHFGWQTWSACASFWSPVIGRTWASSAPFVAWVSWYSVPFVAWEV